MPLRGNKEERKACFNCDEKFSPGHECKAKLFRLSADTNELIEVENPEIYYEEQFDVDLTPEYAERIEISCNALEENPAANTIRVLASVNNKIVSVLVDPGSTYNFIQSDVAKSLKRPI